MRRRRPAVPVALMAAAVALFTMVGPALACGGLIGPNGAVNLLRTTTFVGYHAGVEHYITSFEFVGGGGRFGSITPLPGVPSNVERGGDWTLQRLIRETQPAKERSLLDAFAAPAAAGAQVLLQTRIDALDITVLKGGGDDVGAWAKANGFRLPPDAPEVLDFYAARSPIFLAASFDGDAAAARGQNIGDGTPIHVTIPTPNPWVPLHILGLGKSDAERVEADVYLLTDAVPSFLPAPTGRGMSLAHGAPATESLLSDLRSDKGMDWIPASGWLTQIRLDAAPSELSYDLAVDATGQGTPSRVAAGLAQPAAIGGSFLPVWPFVLLFGAYVIAIALVVVRIGRRPVPSS
ncbi:MAG: DUF2330 domain-containing protein [Chloroflexota bacterium]|nr:DUF2330 domain-containing protein [Chloroflexota bacterium]